MVCKCMFGLMKLYSVAIQGHVGICIFVIWAILVFGDTRILVMSCFGCTSAHAGVCPQLVDGSEMYRIALDYLN